MLTHWALLFNSISHTESNKTQNLTVTIAFSLIIFIDKYTPRPQRGALGASKYLNKIYSYATYVQRHGAPAAAQSAAAGHH